MNKVYTVQVHFERLVLISPLPSVFMGNHAHIPLTFIAIFALNSTVIFPETYARLLLKYHTNLCYLI